MIQLLYSHEDFLSESFIILVNNKAVAWYQRYDDEWSKFNRSSKKWVSLEGDINPIKMAKDIAKRNNCGLQLVTNTSVGEIISTVL